MSLGTGDILSYFYLTPVTAFLLLWVGGECCPTNDYPHSLDRQQFLPRFVLILKEDASPILSLLEGLKVLFASVL